MEGWVPKHAKSQRKSKCRNLYGHKKRVSDAIVARTINNLGFRNFRGNPFSRKSVWQLRQHPIYLHINSEDIMDPLTAQAKLIFERDEARERVKELEQEADISITGGGMYSQERYDQCLETKDNALGDMGYASGKLQLKYREHPAPDINWDELEWAVCDALLNEGTIIAWPGDGVSCVAQMINAQHERAITAEHSQVTTKLCLDTKVEQYDKLRQLQMKTFEENERLREALELIADDWPQAPFGSKNREYANGFNAGVSSCGEDVEEIARLAIAGGYAVGKLIPTLQAKRKVAYQISMDKYLKEKDNE